MAEFNRTNIEFSQYDSPSFGNDLLLNWSMMSTAMQFDTKSKSLSVTFADNTRFEFTGSFKYFDNNMPKSGFFDSVTYFEDDKEMFSINKFHISVKEYYENSDTDYHITSLYTEIFKGSDHLSGGKMDDQLHGESGSDVLFGGGNYDQLSGGDGNDRLRGGLGRDNLDGGAGADKFIFRSLSESQASFKAGDFDLGSIESVAAKYDTIDHFLQSQHDKIDVSEIDANLNKSGNQAFKFGGIGSNPEVGELSYYRGANNVEYVIANNGDGDLRLKIVIAGALVNHIDFHTDDFIL